VDDRTLGVEHGDPVVGRGHRRRPAPKLAFSLRPRRRVSQDREDPVASVEADGRRGDVDGDDLAVPRVTRQLGGEPASVVANPLDKLLEHVVVVRVNVGRPERQEALPVVAEQLAGSLVATQDAVRRGVDDEDRVGRVLEQPLEDGRRRSVTGRCVVVRGRPAARRRARLGSVAHGVGRSGVCRSAIGGPSRPARSTRTVKKPPASGVRPGSGRRRPRGPHDIVSSSYPSSTSAATSGPCSSPAVPRSGIPSVRQPAVASNAAAQ